MLGWACLAVGTGASIAIAGLTPVEQPWSPVVPGATIERNLIAGTPGSGEFEQSIIGQLATNTDLDYFGVNGATFTRVDDAVDQIWLALAEDQTITATAVFAVADQIGSYKFGTDPGNPAIQLTDVMGMRDFVAEADVETVSLGLTPNDQFRWVLETSWSGGAQRSSLESENTPVFGIQDFMVSYQITGPDVQEGTFLIAFEDGFPDKDYNDFVAIVRGVTVIPEPGAVLLGLLGVGLVTPIRRLTGQQ